MKGFYLVVINALLITFVSAQKQSVAYMSPLDIDLVLNGTFGELRANHFHSGIDFSTSRKIGYSVYAVEDGEINRIKISAFGYGNVLYVKHPDGYTTVYAHLDNFAEPIASYVKNEQYKQKKFDVELFPLKNELSVKKGNVIAYSGNTGSSGGPHLHFEIRNTETESIINPYILGMFTEIKDTQKPIVNGLWVYPKSDSVAIQGIYRMLPLEYKRMGNGSYRSDKIFVNGEVGFGINSYDVLENSFGKNGIYEMIMKVNGTVYSHVKFDEFTFDQTRYINHYIDFEKLQLDGQRVQKLFNKNMHPIPVYKVLKNSGFVPVKENEDYEIVIEVSDFHKNKQIFSIPISYKNYPLPVTEQPNGKFIDYYRDYIFEENDKYVEWKAKTFYEDFYIDIQLKEDEIILGPNTIAVHENIDLRFNVKNLSIQKEKAFIGRIEGDKIFYNETWKRGDDFRIRTKNMGVFKIVEDLEPPTLTNKTISNLKLTDDLIFEIDDKLSGIGEITANINGSWALFTYDYKTKLITHKLSDGVAVKGKNNLILEIKDRTGNNVIFEYPFTIP